ncbi:hypothetical protein [Edaphocola flava]|uniref:hypothetical protein n=1 Tax=Edaphocola flava TaxID=2499629 RepID=UPI00100AEF9A|nr:hypothetical protein [Edaphocola flava]
MKKIEPILITLVFTGVVLKQFHIAGHATIITLSILILAFIYMIFGFALFNDIRLRDIFKKSAYQQLNVWRIIGSVFLGLTLSTSVVAILFGLQDMPGKEYMLLISMLELAPAFLVVLFKTIQHKSSFYIKVLSRVSAVIILIALLWQYPGIL